MVSPSTLRYYALAAIGQSDANDEFAAEVPLIGALCAIVGCILAGIYMGPYAAPFVGLAGFVVGVLIATRGVDGYDALMQGGQSADQPGTRLARVPN